MTQATLTLDGIEPLHGTIETGGDYIRFRTEGGMDPDRLARLTEGQIDIDGKSEKVMIKNVQSRSPEQGADNGLELTLQRFAPTP